MYYCSSKTGNIDEGETVAQCRCSPTTPSSSCQLHTDGKILRVKVKFIETACILLCCSRILCLGFFSVMDDLISPVVLCFRVNLFSFGLDFFISEMDKFCPRHLGNFEFLKSND